MQNWTGSQQLRGVLRTSLVVLAVVYTCALPIHVGIARYQLRQRSLRSLVSETHSRAAIVAVYMNDRRNEIRHLIESGTIQRHSTERSPDRASIEAISRILGQFGIDRRFGQAPVYSSLVFVAMDGTYRSVPVPDSKPLSLTRDALQALINPLYYIQPTYLTYRQESGQPMLLLSVAVLSAGALQGQLLAVLNPAALDDRLRAAPPFAGRAVYLLTPGGEDAYVPDGTPVRWSPALLSLLQKPQDTPVSLRVEDPEDTRESLIHTAVRTPLPASEFGLICLDPAKDVPAIGSIVRVSALYIIVGAVLLGLAYAGWMRPDSGSGWHGLMTDESVLFRALFENLPTGIMVADTEGKVQFISRAFEKQNGIPNSKAHNRLAKALLGETVEEPDTGNLNRALQGRQTWTGRLKTRRSDGGLYTSEVLVFPIRGNDDEVKGIVALQSDITPQAQAEQRLRQAQKMEAVGVLADGIAHDFNNLLTVIQGNCNLLLYGAESLDTFARDNIDEILRACDRAAAMTRRLLAFSRHREVQMEILDLNEVVGSTEKMLSQLIRENVDMSVRLGDQPVLVKADIVQLEQIIINLTVNARDAMPRGGRLTVRVGTETLTDRRADLDLPEGEYAIMTVEDTGHGIDEATRRRIFEPFFTTKSEKEGTGLRLTTVHTIVKEHSGGLTVQSEVGTGTTFLVFLPLHQEEAAGTPGASAAVVPVPAPPRAAKSTQGTGLGILLLDDEESVLRMIERALTAHGYNVFAARTDVELLVAWEEHRDSIDLLVTDMVMPGMSGVEIADRLRQDNPNLKVLNISAYTDTVIMKLGGKEQNDTLFLQKPFTPDVLVGKVREMLADLLPRDADADDPEGAA